MSPAAPSEGTRGARRQQTTDRPQADDHRIAADRITVALIPRTAQDLHNLQDRTGFSKTDIVNRAITAYEFFDELTRAGHEIIIRDPETGERQKVKFL